MKNYFMLIDWKEQYYQNDNILPKVYKFNTIDIQMQITFF